VGEQTVSIRAFGVLGSILRDHGHPSTLAYAIPSEGLSASEIAAELELPLDRIEGVFQNHVIRSVEQTIMPGDSIAFVPYGTPGPHRFFLGLYEAGKAEE
jgi:hypothetical protein